jgi:ribose 5-phosphate isomerase B
MRIAVGADHGGFRLKDQLAAWLVTAGHGVTDVGVHDGSSVDYPDVAREAVGLLTAGEVDRVLRVCGTGQGMAMSANKIPGVRAAVVADVFSAKMASAHNDAKVLCVGERVLGVGLALECVAAWLATEFEGGRHARRIDKLESTPA